MSTAPSGVSPIDILIVTTLDDELNALLQALPSSARRISSPAVGGVSYECTITLPHVNGGEFSYHIVITQSSVGRVHAGVATSAAIHQWHPRFVLLIGLAGGVEQNGIQIGDIIIADQIVDYESQKLTADGAETRWTVFRADPVLLDAARHTARGKWASQIKIRVPNRKKIRCHFGPIASGDKVIASRDALQKLLSDWPKLIGIEMEATGVAAAASQVSPASGFLMIRSVADLADGAKNDQGRGSAIAAVVAFTVALIQDASIPPVTSSHTAPGGPNLIQETVRAPETSAPPVRDEPQVIAPVAVDGHRTSQPPEVPRADSGSVVPELSTLVLPLGYPRPQLVGFTADKPGGDDLLDVHLDVDAFASLIAARTTPPPLSIGLFGEWGSGKTFFMQQIKQRVTDITEEACSSDRMQKDIAYYKHIIQIEFNAWHYVEGNLWASLVEHILRKLLTMGTTPNVVRMLHAEILAKIGVQTNLQNDLQNQVDENSSKIEKIVGSIEEKTKELAETTEEIQKINARNIRATLSEQDEVKRELQKLNELRNEIGLPRVEEAAGDLQAAIAETQALTRRGTTLLMSLGRDNKLGRQLFWLVLLFVVGPASGWAVLQIGQYLTNPSTHWVTQTVAVLAVVNTWLISLAATIRRASRWLSERMTVVEQLKQRWDRRVADAQESIRAELASFERRRLELETELAAKEIQLAAAKARTEQLHAELIEAAPVQLLTKFLHERVESDDYQKYLGLLAIIRRDFEQMSQFIESENERTLNFSTLTEERHGDERRINRIVLYIDDLDRCPTDKVIQVLQAVHLLLAFPLFVVVVAVDARWISGALRERYGDLLTAGDTPNTNGTPPDAYVAATAVDYLEKIFQIPFWLSPMSLSARRNLVAGILAGSIVDEVQSSELLEVARPSVDGERITPLEPSGSVIETIEAADAFDLNPDALSIYPAEFTFINTLTPLLGRSPRALKRFINVYRVLKSSLSSADYAAFSGASGTTAEFPIAMFLLAIVTNAPGISQPFFSALSTQISVLEAQQVVSADDWKKVLETKHPTPQWAALRVFLATEAATPVNDVRVDRVAWWAQRVTRFSFQIEPRTLESFTPFIGP